MTTETTIHVPATEFDNAIAAVVIRDYLNRVITPGEELTIGLYLGGGVWELISDTVGAPNGFAPVTMTQMPGELVGKVWIEEINGKPAVIVDRT